MQNVFFHDFGRREHFVFHAIPALANQCHSQVRVNAYFFQADEFYKAFLGIPGNQDALVDFQKVVKIYPSKFPDFIKPGIRQFPEYGIYRAREESKGVPGGSTGCRAAGH